MESARQTMPLDVCPDRPSTATIDLPDYQWDVFFENSYHVFTIYGLLHCHHPERLTRLLARIALNS
jgi:hypothetical protein